MSGRVAVIAVHGVADQLPFVTARQTADLLKCRLTDEGPGFAEEQLRIEVHPVRVPPPPPATPDPAADKQKKFPGDAKAVGTEPASSTSSSPAPATSSGWSAGVDLACDSPEAWRAGKEKREAHRNLARGVKETPAQPAENDRQEILDFSRRASDQYYAAQLRDYRQRPEDAVYETVRLSSTLRGTEVDVYEMYWADLSRVRTAVLQAVEELYYVLFFVCNIGRMELERSRALFTKLPWGGLRWCEAFAERVLTLVVPLGNLCLLLLMVFTLPHLLPGEFAAESPQFLASAGIGVGLVLGAIRVFSLPHQLPDLFPAESPKVLPPAGFADRYLVRPVLFVWDHTVVFVWRHTGGFVWRFLCRLMWHFSRPPLGASGLLLLFGLGGFEIGCAISGLSPDNIRLVLSLLLWTASCAVLRVLSQRFNNRQPGASWVGFVLGGLVFLAVWWEAADRSRQEKYWALDIGLATAEWILLGLMVAWLGYLLAAAACTLLGYIVVGRERKSPPRFTTARRIVWTANLAILAPGILFIVLNLGIWQALSTVKGYLIPTLLPAALSHAPAGPYAGWLKTLDEYEQHAKSPPETKSSPEAKSPPQSGEKTPAPPEPCCQFQLSDAKSQLIEAWPQFIKKLLKLIGRNTGQDAQQRPEITFEANRVPDLLIRNSARPMFIALGALVLMLLSAGWLLLPAILAEGAKESDPGHEYAKQLGNSLSFAWRGLRVCAGPLVRGQLFVLIAVCVGIACHKPNDHNLSGLSVTLSVPALWAVGWLFAALATGVLQFAFAGLRTVIDVAADVANWLRLHPRDYNPTSRISARYVSLLRYVAQQTETDEKNVTQPKYDRVVIFAHSLGSAITVDLLQFLKPDSKKDGFKDRADEALERLPPIHLFTHGCPLRQLLGLRLPITYGWAWHGSKGWKQNEEPKGEELLRVEKWVNAYCSGDYVGRYLWHDDVSDKPWDTEHRKKPGTVPRVELCVGAGAHVHYWDPEPRATGTGTTTASAPSTKIADELLKLIGIGGA